MKLSRQKNGTGVQLSFQNYLPVVYRKHRGQRNMLSDTVGVQGEPVGNSVGALLEDPPWASSIRITWESVRSLRPPVDLLNQNPLVGRRNLF